jgi:hypothetical protein
MANGQEWRDGYIRSCIQSRRLMPSFETKHNSKQIKKIESLIINNIYKSYLMFKVIINGIFQMALPHDSINI